MGQNYKYEWLVKVPANKSLIVALTAACKRNDKLGSLLEYFHYNASIEAKKQGLAIGIEEITITRTLDNIISGLSHSGKPASKKTIIQWIVNLQSLNYIHADGPHHKYTICLKNIQAGIDTPPEPEKAKLRGIHARRAALEAAIEDNEHCKITMSPKITMSQENSVISALDIVKLQSDIVDLQCVIVKLQSDIVDLQCVESRQAACIAALEGEIESLLSNTILHTINNTNVSTPPADAVPSNLPAKRRVTKTEKPVTPIEEKPYFGSIHENNFYSLWLASWINKHKPMKAPTEIARGHVKVIAALIQTEEALNQLITITEKEMKARGHTGLPELGNLRRSLAEWERNYGPASSPPDESSNDEPALEEDENRLVVWSKYGITKPREAVQNWFMFDLMPINEARQYGFQREFVSNTRKDIANMLDHCTPEKLEALRARYLSSKIPALVSA